MSGRKRYLTSNACASSLRGVGHAYVQRPHKFESMNRAAARPPLRMLCNKRVAAKNSMGEDTLLESRVPEGGMPMCACDYTIQVQMYDEELEDFVDLEPDIEVPNKAKIKLVRKVLLATEDTQATRAHSPTCLPIDETDSGLDESCSTVNGRQEVPLQNPRDYLLFVFPSLEPFEAVLARKQPISSKLRKFILNKLFQACFKLVWYPSQALYRTCIEQLLKKYPHLIDRTGDEAGMVSWVTGLRNRFKNVRKKAVNITEAMKALKEKSHHKRPRAAASLPAEPNKKLCRLTDCSHLVVYGETNASLATHDEWLQDSVTVPQHDEELRPRLLATAQDRHTKLRNMRVLEAKDAYPFLFTEQALLMEFNILYKVDIVEKMQVGLSKLCTIVLRHGEESEVAMVAQSSEQDSVRTALAVIMRRCLDGLESLLTENEPPLEPCLVVKDGTVVLFVDRQPCFEVSNLLGGLCSLFAVFWVLHIQYPKAAHRTLTFFEHAFLGLNKTRPRVKALELINFFIGLQATQ